MKILIIPTPKVVMRNKYNIACKMLSTRELLLLLRLVFSLDGPFKKKSQDFIVIGLFLLLKLNT